MEKVRRIIRGMLGYDSRIYRAGSKALEFYLTARTEGIRSWRTLNQLSNEAERGKPPRSIVLSSLTYPILVRPGTADADTLINNVVRGEYGRLVSHRNPTWMIDAGAYIGDTTAYFLSRFPKLRVIALEPNPESFEIAKRNLRPYAERAILLQKALFSREQINAFSGDEIGASIAPTGIEIECTTVSSLLRDYRISRLDILKMDIEGAEEAVFSSQAEEWLCRTSLLLVEIHSSRIKSKIIDMLDRNGFDTQQYRSIWCAAQRQPVASLIN
jgi:FkbM family methyltransferase